MSIADLLVMPVRDAETAQAMFAFAQKLGAARGVNFRATPPEPSTCCGRGCNGCVWEGFVTAAHYWREDALAALNATP